MVIKIRLFNAVHSSLPIPFSAYSSTTLNLRSPGRNISYFRLSDWNQKSKSYLTPPSYTLYVEIIQREIDKSQSRKTVYLFTSQTFINCHALVQILQSSDLQQQQQLLTIKSSVQPTLNSNSYLTQLFYLSMQTSKIFCRVLNGSMEFQSFFSILELFYGITLKKY